MELVVNHGGGHGWWNMIWDIRRFADWFDRYLRQWHALMDRLADRWKARGFYGGRCRIRQDSTKRIQRQA
jgi:hypothetical protein